jgi:pimeloyl-ACP methyl ester carboxylesterase
MVSRAVTQLYDDILRPSGLRVTQFSILATIARRGEANLRHLERALAIEVRAAADLFSQKLDGVAWRSKPSWYIVANKDRTVQPELQRFVAKRMRATIYEVGTSHVPMLSHPSFVIDVIRTAANSVSSGATRTA